MADKLRPLLITLGYLMCLSLVGYGSYEVAEGVGGQQRHRAQAVLSFDDPESRTAFHADPGYPHRANATD